MSRTVLGMVRWVVVVLTSAASGVVIAQPGGGGGPPPASVVVDAIRSERVEQWREVTGELRSVKRSIVATESEGLVVEVLVEAGELVREGEPLARLKDRLARLEVQRSDATHSMQGAIVAQRQAELEQSERDLQRLERSFDKGGVNSTEVDDGRTALSRARARLAEAEAESRTAEAELELARERLSHMTIAAPFTGTVIMKGTETGQWIREGDAVVEMIATDMVDGWLEVPERFVSRLRAGRDRVQVRLPGQDLVVEAAIAAIVPLADETSRLFPVRVRLANPDGLLSPGMSVVGLIPTGVEAESMTVHKDALRRDDAGSFLFFDGDGVAVPARLETRFTIGDRMVIESRSLRPGMRAIVEGNERLYPTQPLAIIGERDAVPDGDRQEGGS